MSRIGDNIKKTRNESGMTQKQLAKKLGVAESFIYEVEMGRKVPSENIINRLSKLFKKDMNDINMYIEEEMAQEVKSDYKPPVHRNEKANELWTDALGSVLKSVPVYKYNLTDVLGSRELPIISNKIEGHAQDKVFFLMVEEDDMTGYRIQKGDIAFCHVTHEVENNSICFIEYNVTRAIRQIKKLDASKVLLIRSASSTMTETVNAADIKVLARLDKLEIKL